MPLGTWAEWGRKIVDQLESQERSIKDLERAVASLVVKMAIVSAIASTVMSALVAFILKKIA